jgi:hypothetical protein
LEKSKVSDGQIQVAISLAKILFNTRERFLDALHIAARARLEENRLTLCSSRTQVSRAAIEPHVDEALCAIYRDGLIGLEETVQDAVHEIVREELDAARKAAWRSL